MREFQCGFAWRNQSIVGKSEIVRIEWRRDRGLRRSQWWRSSIRFCRCEFWCLDLISYKKKKEQKSMTLNCMHDQWKKNKPGGKNWLKPRMSSTWPLNNVFTRPMTPSVSILAENEQDMKRKWRCLKKVRKKVKQYVCALKSFMISKNWLYTAGRSEKLVFYQ